jgi:hypothetical protein
VKTAQDEDDVLGFGKRRLQSYIEVCGVCERGMRLVRRKGTRGCYERGGGARRKTARWIDRNGFKVFGMPKHA